jgi:RimJ/RimL family protein N-acetyltransferase
MATPFLRTERLDLQLQSGEEVRRWVDGLEPAVRKEISPDWLKRVLGVPADPWLHGFLLVDRALGVVVGRAGFKGPPDEAGRVEIAYGVEPEREGKGYATRRRRH